MVCLVDDAQELRDEGAFHEEQDREIAAECSHPLQFFDDRELTCCLDGWELENYRSEEKRRVHGASLLLDPMTMEELVTSVVGDGSGEYQDAKQNYLRERAKHQLAERQGVPVSSTGDVTADGQARAARRPWELVAILQRCPSCGIEGAYRVETAGVHFGLESCDDCNDNVEGLNDADYFGRRLFLFDKAPANVTETTGNGSGAGAAMEVSTTSVLTPSVLTPSVSTGFTRTATAVGNQTESSQSANASKGAAIEAQVQKWRSALLQDKSTEVLQTFVQFALARPDEVLDLLPTSPYYIDVTLSKRSTVLEVRVSRILASGQQRMVNSKHAHSCKEKTLWYL
jgi:hypothetical protein